MDTPARNCRSLYYNCSKKGIVIKTVKSIKTLSLISLLMPHIIAMNRQFDTTSQYPSHTKKLGRAHSRLKTPSLCMQFTFSKVQHEIYLNLKHARKGRNKPGKVATNL